MAETLATIAATVTGEIVRNDLLSEAKAEVANVIRFLNSQPFAFTELRDGTLTTADGTPFYSTADFTSASGPQTKTTVSFQDIVDIDMAEVEEGGRRLHLGRLNYRDYRALETGVTSPSRPRDYVVYAGQFGLWPTPGAAYTVYLSGRVKPDVPSADGDGSIWFDRAYELVTEMTCERVLRKHVMDIEAAREHEAGARVIMSTLSHESAKQRATGRTTPTEY